MFDDAIWNAFISIELDFVSKQESSQFGIEHTHQTLKIKHHLHSS